MNSDTLLESTTKDSISDPDELANQSDISSAAPNPNLADFVDVVFLLLEPILKDHALLRAAGAGEYVVSLRDVDHLPHPVRVYCTPHTQCVVHLQTVI